MNSGIPKGLSVPDPLTLLLKMIVFTVFNNTKWWTCTSYHVYFGALYCNCTLILKWLFVCFCFLFICFYLAWLCFSRIWFKWFNTLHYPLILLLIIKVILHQLWMKNFFPWKFNMEYGGTFSKLFMHVSSRNVFPTTRNLQIRVHVCCSRHCCGDWLTFGYFVPMIADHDLVNKR